MKNRRKDTRHRINLKGKLDFEGLKVPCETFDLSFSGVGLVTDMPLLEGAHIGLELVFNSGKSKKLLRIRGIVVWCHEHIEVGYQTGIHFSPTPKDEQLLQEYLARFQ